MRAPITDKHLLEMMWERFPEIMKRGAGQPTPEDSSVVQPAQQEPVANYCRECLTYNGHHEGCSHYSSQPAQQEPVGEVSGHDWSTGILYRDLEPGAPLYTSPQPAQRKPLTDEAIRDCWSSVQGVTGVSPKIHAFARAIEAKLKEKNT